MNTGPLLAFYFAEINKLAESEATKAKLKLISHLAPSHLYTFRNILDTSLETVKSFSPQQIANFLKLYDVCGSTQRDTLDKEFQELAEDALKSGQPLVAYQAASLISNPQPSVELLRALTKSVSLDHVIEMQCRELRHLAPYLFLRNPAQGKELVGKIVALLVPQG